MLRGNCSCTLCLLTEKMLMPILGVVSVLAMLLKKVLLLQDEKHNIKVKARVKLHLKFVESVEMNLKKVQQSKQLEK